MCSHTKEQFDKITGNKEKAKELKLGFNLDRKEVEDKVNSALRKEPAYLLGLVEGREGVIKEAKLINLIEIRKKWDVVYAQRKAIDALTFIEAFNFWLLEEINDEKKLGGKDRTSSKQGVCVPKTMTYPVVSPNKVLLIGLLLLFLFVSGCDLERSGKFSIKDYELNCRNVCLGQLLTFDNVTVDDKYYYYCYCNRIERFKR